jgi:hypothetical protein
MELLSFPHNRGLLRATAPRRVALRGRPQNRPRPLPSFRPVTSRPCLRSTDRSEDGEAAGAIAAHLATSRVLGPLQCLVLSLGEGDETALQQRPQAG